jgi:hypothetical protein
MPSSTVITQQPVVVDPAPVVVGATTAQTVMPTSTVVVSDTKPIASTCVVQPMNPIISTPEPVVTAYSQPNLSLPIVDEEERRFWIGNVLYNMLPDNGMAKFTSEVKALSDKMRYNTFGSILQTLRDYVAEKSRREVAISQLLDLTRQVGYPAGMIYPGSTSYHPEIPPPYNSGGLYPPPQQPWSMFYQNSIYPNFLESQVYNPYFGVNQYQMADGNLVRGFYNPYHTWPGSYTNRLGYFNPALAYDKSVLPAVEMFTNGGGGDGTKGVSTPALSVVPKKYQREYQMNNQWARNGGESLI